MHIPSMSEDLKTLKTVSLPYGLRATNSIARIGTKVNTRENVGRGQRNRQEVGHLNAISFQCACGKLSTARKTKSIPKIFFNGKKTFKKCNPPDF